MRWNLFAHPHCYILANRRKMEVPFPPHEHNLADRTILDAASRFLQRPKCDPRRFLRAPENPQRAWQFRAAGSLCNSRDTRRSSLRETDAALDWVMVRARRQQLPQICPIDLNARTTSFPRPALPLPGTGCPAHRGCIYDCNAGADAQTPTHLHLIRIIREWSHKFCICFENLKLDSINGGAPVWSAIWTMPPARFPPGLGHFRGDLFTNPLSLHSLRPRQTHFRRDLLTNSSSPHSR